MSALPVERLLPELVPATDVQDIVWKGALAHIGPRVKSTPLHGELQGITCCGLYLLYIGCVGLISKRMAPVMNTNLNRCLLGTDFRISVRLAIPGNLWDHTYRY